MKKLYHNIRVEIYSVLRWINFKLSCREAMRLHNLNGKQYFVVPTSGIKFTIINKTKQNNYNKIAKKMKLKKITYNDLLHLAYFKTPT